MFQTIINGDNYFIFLDSIYISWLIISLLKQKWKIFSLLEIEILDYMRFSIYFYYLFDVLINYFTKHYSILRLLWSLQLNYQNSLLKYYYLLFLQSERMLFRGQGCCPGFTAERKSSSLEAGFGGRMRYSATLAVYVLPVEAWGDFEDGEYKGFSKPLF